MAIVTNIRSRGSKTTQTLSGNVIIDEGAGVMLIRRNGVDLVRIDSRGFVYSDTNGVRQILIGAHPVDGHVGDWQTKPGIDVITELMNG